MCDLSCTIDGFCLGSMDRGRFAATFLLHGPLALMRYHVKIGIRHDQLSSLVAALKSGQLPSRPDALYWAIPEKEGV